MRVLVGCEVSGVVRRAFRDKGHDAWSCDLFPPDDNSPFHIQGDILSVPISSFDLAIIHPPCTYLSNSGVKHLYQSRLVMMPSGKFVKQNRKVHGIDPVRWKNMEEAAAFFNRVLDIKCPRLCVENPVQHEQAILRIPRRYTQTIQPHEYGHPELKTTHLWLRGLPPLVPTNPLPPPYRTSVHDMGPSPTRGKDRAKTFQGWANAMASQWNF